MPNYRADDYSEYKKRKAKELKRFGLPQGKCRVCGSTNVGADEVVRDGKLVIVARKLCSECDPVYRQALAEAEKVKGCTKCGRQFSGSTMAICNTCFGADLVKEKPAPTFEGQPYRYAQNYGKQAIIDTLKERWANGNPARH